MSGKDFFARYGGKGPESYQRFFVPVIGEPLAVDLLGGARRWRTAR
jgi:hypothetical protein